MNDSSTVGDEPTLPWALGEAYQRKGQLKEAMQQLEKFQTLTADDLAEYSARRKDHNA
jgi:hypothetical protein